eukprot:1874668-Amphidinium_carterae.1
MQQYLLNRHYPPLCKCACTSASQGGLRRLACLAIRVQRCAPSFNRPQVFPPYSALSIVSLVASRELTKRTGKYEIIPFLPMLCFSSFNELVCTIADSTNSSTPACWPTQSLYSCQLNSNQHHQAFNFTCARSPWHGYRCLMLFCMAVLSCVMLGPAGQSRGFAFKKKTSTQLCNAND